MKVEVVIQKDLVENYAVIYAAELTQEVENAASFLSAQDNAITALCDERRIILRPQEIFMARVEEEALFLYTQNKKYLCKKRLYEITETLGGGFIQISKGTVINIKQAFYVEPSLGGLMKVKLKNGLSDYISRKYLPDFKKYLGL